VAVITAAALRENWSGPLFIQGDHFQAKAAAPGQPKEGEIEIIEQLIKEAIGAGFYNIDIDMSTLVDLDKPTEAEQQIPNYQFSAQLAQLVRLLEPKGITVSLGTEIGHVGGKNSTVADLAAFMAGFVKKLPTDLTSISKISVQTGTSHGGKVLADGTLADIDVDFQILQDITQACQEKYQVGGAVQHGASTLPDQYFNQFVKFGALEVHLATGFQNLLLDHPQLPDGLRQEMYGYIDKHHADERPKNKTKAQFHYELRKKALGPFKQRLWELPATNRRAIRASLKDRFSFFFQALNVVKTKDLVEKTVTRHVVEKTLKDFKVSDQKTKNIKGLAD
jgi:fructose/tagatose bisphosphate aldolase